MSSNHINLKLDYDAEANGRVIADIAAIPGAIAFAPTAEQAARKALSIALQVIADEIEHGELSPDNLVITMDSQPGKTEAATPKLSIRSGYSIDELLEQTDFEALADDENMKAWRDVKPVGRELL